MALLGKLFKGKSSRKAPKGFKAIKIKEITKLTDEAVKVTLDLDSRSFSFIPGQYIDFSIQVDGKEERRSYSICSGEGELVSVAVKKVENGTISKWFNEVAQADMEVFVSEASGNFTLSDSDKNIVAIAAGSGITPIMSIAKACETSDRSMRLYYGNRTPNSVLFKEEIDGLKNTDCNYYYSAEKLDGAGEGRIDKERFTEIIKSDLSLLRADSYFLCGPEELIIATKEVLELFGVPKEKIHYELFTTPVNMKSDPPVKSSVSDFEGVAKVTLILDDEKEQFELEADGMSILDKAKKEGIDAPFSCMGGVCSTCRAKVLEGKARMDMNYALTDKEVEEGFILTCQSHPTTEKIIVSYDE